MFERYYSPYGTSRLERFLKLLSAYFRVGTFFGVEVRVFWVAAILMPAMTLYELLKLQSLSLSAVVGMTLVINLGLALIIYAHEMGHIAAGWRYGIPSRMITLSPIGGLAHMSSPAPSAKANAVISLAGPATHLLWLVAFAPLHYFSDSIFPARLWGLHWAARFFFETNLVLLFFNLLPFYPMDGGSVLKSVLSSRMHPNRALIWAARVGMVGAVGFLLWGLFGQDDFYGVILVFIGISNFMACRRALTAARYQISPYAQGGPPLAPWQTDADAWKAGGKQGWGGGKQGLGKQPPSAPRKPGRVATWLAARRERQAKELADEVDRILVKIKDVGMGELTRTERDTLGRASKKARKKP